MLAASQQVPLVSNSRAETVQSKRGLRRGRPTSTCIGSPRTPLFAGSRALIASGPRATPRADVNNWEPVSLGAGPTEHATQPRISRGQAVATNSPPGRTAMPQIVADCDSHQIHTHRGCPAVPFILPACCHGLHTTETQGPHPPAFAREGSKNPPDLQSLREIFQLEQASTKLLWLELARFDRSLT